MDALSVTWLIQAGATWMMVGLIWFIQLVHYPLYKRIGEGFVDYERSHLRRAAWLMGPVMLIEALSALFLVGMQSTPEFTNYAIINLILLILIWVSTCLFQVQLHQKLSVRFSKKLHRNLLSTNWVRVILWSLRGILVLSMLSQL